MKAFLGFQTLLRQYLAFKRFTVTTSEAGALSRDHVPAGCDRRARGRLGYARGEMTLGRHFSLPLAFQLQELAAQLLNILNFQLAARSSLQSLLGKQSPRRAGAGF